MHTIGRCVSVPALQTDILFLRAVIPWGSLDRYWPQRGPYPLYKY